MLTTLNKEQRLRNFKRAAAAIEKIDDESAVADVMHKIEEQRLKVEDEMDVLQYPAQLCALAERQWKMSHSSYINVPNHVCEADKCQMKRVKVMVYRRKSASAFTAMFDYEKAGEHLNSNVHVCLPDICEHLKEGHHCPQPDACRYQTCVHLPRLCANPAYVRQHKIKRDVRCGRLTCVHIDISFPCMVPPDCCHAKNRPYRPDEMRELKDFWICEQTGMGHLCGDACLQRKIVSTREKHIICSLTKCIIQGTLEHEDAWKCDIRNSMNLPYYYNHLKIGDAPLTEAKAANLLLAEDDYKKFSRNSRHSIASCSNDTKADDNNNNNNLITSSPLLLLSRIGEADGGVGHSTHKSMMSNNNNNGGEATAAPITVLPPWQRQNEIVINTTIAKMLFKELMFSKRRQTNELNLIISSRAQMFKETHKAMRHKKMAEAPSRDLLAFEKNFRDHGDRQVTLGLYSAPTKIHNALLTFSRHNYVSEYFKYVPIMSSLIPHARQQLRDINNRYLTTPASLERLNNVPLQRQHQATIDRLKAANARLLGQTVQRFLQHHPREEQDEDDDAQKHAAAATGAIILPRWDSAEWTESVEAITDLVARVLVKIWMNLSEYCVDWHGAGSEISFKRIVLPLMYMLQTNFSLNAYSMGGSQHMTTAAAAAAATVSGVADLADRAPQIIVVPRIEYARLLPCESNVSRYAIAHLCNPSSKTITSIQTSIQSLLYQGALNGKVQYLRVTLSDFAI
jgi:hypothetical protein